MEYSSCSLWGMAVWVWLPMGRRRSFSYRDPNIVETLERYDGQVEYLENFNLSEAEFEKNFDYTIQHDWPSTFSRSKKGQHAVTSLIWHKRKYNSSVMKS